MAQPVPPAGPPENPNFPAAPMGPPANWSAAKSPAGRKPRNACALQNWPWTYPDHVYTPDPSMNDDICYALLQTGVVVDDGYDMTVQCGLHRTDHPQ